MKTAPSTNSFIYGRIAARLENDIRRNLYRPGERIPSIRELCRTEQVSPGSVLQALGLLEARGLIRARPKSGYFVLAGQGTPLPEPRPSNIPVSRPQVVGVCNVVAEIMREANNPRLTPLGTALPSPSLLPTEKLSRTLAAAVRSDPEMLGRYEVFPGHPELLRQLARRFHAMGCFIPQDEIVVSCGATEALNLAIRAVTRPGDVVAVESPCYFGLLEMLESLGLKVILIPSTCQEGIDLDDLVTALEQYPVKAIALIPSFSNPNGACLSDEKRQRLADIVEDFGVPLIEDDLYGDLYFEGERPRPVKAFDRTGKVIYCSSFSKTLSPGLRVGWVAAGIYTEHVRRLKWISTLNTPPVNQLAIARFLASESMERHLRRFRAALALQVEQMSEAIRAAFPSGTAISRPRGGMVLWVELPPNVNCVELYRRALLAEIIIMPGTVFCPVGEIFNKIRISCGSPVDAATLSAVSRLGTIVAELTCKSEIRA